MKEVKKKAGRGVTLQLRVAFVWESGGGSIREEERERVLVDVLGELVEDGFEVFGHVDVAFS